jgi:hypothetical protein
VPGLRALIVVALLVLGATSAHAHGGPSHHHGDDPVPHGASRLRIKLVTFGPGDAVHQYFGHNAMIVEDRVSGQSLLFNYGTFSFGADMLPKFLKGRLEFWISVSDVQPTYRMYRAANRSISERELNLSPARRMYVAQRLEHDAQPENRDYLYDHYRDNCSTRLRDLINQAVDGQLKRANSGPARFDYRGLTRRYASHDPLVDLLLIFWMNDQQEQPITRYDEAFLPGELERQVDALRYRDESGGQVPLVLSARTVFAAKRAAVPERPPTTWPWVLAFSSLVGGVALGLALWWARSGARSARVAFGTWELGVGLVYGLPALVLFLMATLTEHRVTHFNENLLLANPITFLALPAGLRIALGSARARRWMAFGWYALCASSALLLLARALPAFDQAIGYPCALFLPINLGFAAAHAWLERVGTSRAE